MSRRMGYDYRKQSLISTCECNDKVTDLTLRFSVK